MEEFDNLTAPYSRADELMWFMRHVPGLRCGFDTGNFLYNEEDAVKSLSLFRPYIASVHCKDRAFTGKHRQSVRHESRTASCIPWR